MYYKYISNGYILAVGTGGMGEQITEEEFDTISEEIREKPARTETTDYRLCTDLTWEVYEVDPPDPDPELDDEQALAILLGGAV